MSALRKAANGQSCIRCGREGLTVSCHYSGPFQHKLGKGRGIKGNDIAAADLCGECHAWFDEYKGVNSLNEVTRVIQRLERSEEFLALCLLTAIRRTDEGKL